VPAPYWTPERIIVALRRHAKRWGSPPTMAQWQSAPERDWRGYKRRRRPTAATVQAVFGSWSAGLAAAGLAAQKSGGDPWAECARGHPLEGDNVVVDGRSGKRKCRTCADARYRAKHTPRDEMWTHCKRGHPLEGDNVGVDGRGYRYCLTCKRTRDREGWHRRQARERAA
jgi:hypothetical protein